MDTYSATHGDITTHCPLGSSEVVEWGGDNQLHAGIRQRERLGFGTKQMGKGMGRVALGEIMENFPVILDKTSPVIHDWTLGFSVP
ncbi:MAG: hypothetical protein V3R80_08015 [Candidatus Tectomicrobia bacterium]